MVHNPLSRATTVMLKFSVTGTNFEVLDSGAHPLPSQVLIIHAFVLALTVSERR